MDTISPAPQDAEAHSSRRKGKRRKLFQLHAWVGFNLAFLMALVLATGTLATLSHEIDWLLQHDMRVAPGDKMISWGEMEAAVRTHRPDASILRIEAMEGDHFAYRATLRDEFGRQTFVHINQWTGAISGETRPLTVQRFLRDFHRYLFMPNYLGLPIVSALAFILAVSLYTGLKTARNWRSIMTRLRFSKGIRVAIGDLHKAAGLWASWFFLVIIVTAIWFLAEFGVNVAGDQMEPERPGLSQQRMAEIGPVIHDRSLDEVITVARSVFPEQRITAIEYPTTPSGVFAVLGIQTNPLLRERANGLFLDPVDLSVIGAQREEEISAIAYLNEMADPLHFGFFGGLATKIVWFIFGLLMTGLSITGVWLTWRRLRSRAVSRGQLMTLPVLLASAIFFIAWFDRYVGPDVPEHERKLADRQLSSGTALGVAISQNATGTATGAVRLIAEADGRPNVRRVSLCADGQCTTAAPASSGRKTSIRFAFAPQTIRSATHFRVGVEYRDGTREITGWRLR